jgi:hypothetical protein
MASAQEQPTTSSPPSLNESGFGNQAIYKVKGSGWLRLNIKELLALLVTVFGVGNITAALIIWAVTGKEWNGLTVVISLVMVVLGAYFTVEHKTPAQQEAEIKKAQP